ncbi:Sensor protein srrB [Solibacillus isronensis B3W22]|uniref:histidine kinase n=1 Tax=Solibacillus isronensis B3W22 TaxID=1224748 RepID=K1KRS1_9BACL|nr:HAMP domain-containing sensor histidine kinase [Solibacillus isronensis]AMO86600.1 two-component sensor histidine kinase [Solibacillus silvestris]EKB45181.1 Sensor protein srrB [Solibacillus isronensis B3W22]
MKRKVILYFMIIIILTLTLVMTVFWGALTKYYYQGIANTFQQHVEAIHPRWANEIELTSDRIKDFGDFVIKSYEYDGAELQLLNRDGEMIQSSTGFYEDISYTVDPNLFSSYSPYYEKEELERTEEKVLAMYIPLLLDDKVIGVLRYTTSLTETNLLIQSLLGYGILLCFGVAAIVFLVALQLAQSIVKPFNKIIQFTETMAKGQFEKRIKEDYPAELGEMSKTLNYMADEIVKTDQLKNDFISSISHELRTPLTGIKGWAEMLESPEGLTEKEINFGLRMINSESDRLIKLVEDLLNFSRYESNRIELHPTKFAYATLIEEVTLQLQSKANEKNIRMKLNSTPVSIYADEDKIRQVLLNTLENAIKFSPHNSVIVIKQYESNGKAICIIRDEGIGIKEEQLQHIMNSFYKADVKSVGAGLGLAISRTIILKHGGTIEVNSVYGKGTEVFIELPLNSSL